MAQASAVKAAPAFLGKGEKGKKDEKDKKGKGKGEKGKGKGKGDKRKRTDLPQLCFAFAKGECKNGRNCQYKHALPGDSEKPCPQFQKGNCKFGDKC